MKRRHHLVDDSLYPVFITTTITKWVPVFSDPSIAVRALAILESTRNKHDAMLIAYVLMPSHFHGIIKTAKKGNLSILLKDWKAFSARQIIETCKAAHNDWLNIFQRSAREFKRTPQSGYQVWQPRFDEYAIRTNDQLLIKLNYIHGNPLKHHLSQDTEGYPYSSVHDYSGAKNRYLKVEPLSL